MRNIKFRGKTKSEDFVYGDLLHVEWGPGHPRKTAIVEGYTKSGVIVKTMVIPSTVGQFTGLKDYDGEEIYEGDIVLLSHIRHVVTFQQGLFCLSIDGKITVYNIDPKQLTVIGNIHENKEQCRK